MFVDKTQNNPKTEVANEKEDWQLVVDYMHHSGKYSKVFSNQEHDSVYVLGDGFGNIGNLIFTMVGYDWSHVRDSSNSAIKRMATKIREITKNRN